MKPSTDIADLLALMAALRTPGSGCPWDLEQTFATIAPYTIEEAAEVADAITRDDMVDLKDELGDLLLQVVFHARMAEEAGHFSFPDVVHAITDKLIRRHPHVFGDARALEPDAVKALWAQIKAQEKAERRAAHLASGAPIEAEQGVLSGVPIALPALARALKLQAKASAVGFDWNDARAVLTKLKEEIAEAEEALASNNQDAIAEEIGDFLFAAVNLARHLEVDPESALRSTNLKFERRFASIESDLAERGRTPAESSLHEMDALWNEAKEKERNGSSVSSPGS